MFDNLCARFSGLGATELKKGARGSSGSFESGAEKLMVRSLGVRAKSALLKSYFIKLLEVESPFGVEVAVRKKGLAFEELIVFFLLLKDLQVTEA